MRGVFPESWPNFRTTNYHSILRNLILKRPEGGRTFLGNNSFGKWARMRSFLLLNGCKQPPFAGNLFTSRARRRKAKLIDKRIRNAYLPVASYRYRFLLEVQPSLAYHNVLIFRSMGMIFAVQLALAFAINTSITSLRCIVAEQIDLCCLG